MDGTLKLNYDDKKNNFMQGSMEGKVHINFNMGHNMCGQG